MLLVLTKELGHFSELASIRGKGAYTLVWLIGRLQTESHRNDFKNWLWFLFFYVAQKYINYFLIII